MSILIFIAELQNTIDELEKINNDIKPSVKVDIFNRSLPKELRWINVFQFKNDWIKCSEYVKDVLPEIISSNLKESINNNQNNKNIFSIEINNNINSNKKKLTKTKAFTKFTKNDRCNYCGELGHFFHDCKNRRDDKNNNKRRKIFKPRRNNFKRKHNKHKNYANLIEKHKFDTSYADDFIEDYNSQDNLSINLVTINKYNYNNQKEKTPVPQ